MGDCAGEAEAGDQERLRLANIRGGDGARVTLEPRAGSLEGHVGGDFTMARRDEDELAQLMPWNFRAGRARAYRLPLIKWLHPEDCERALSDLTQALETGYDAAIELFIVRASSEIRWRPSCNLAASQFD